MTTYLFLAKGESIATARVVAVSADKGVVGRFIDALARDDEAEPEVESPGASSPVLQVVRDGEE